MKRSERVKEKGLSYKEIIKSKDFLHDVLENMADGVVVSDSKGTILHINRAISEILGYSPEEIIGKTTSIFTAPQRDSHAPNYRNVFHTLHKKGKSAFLHDHFKRKDGQLIPVDVNISLLKDQMGKIIGSVGVIRDITYREEMERVLKESEERFRNIVEIANDGIVMVDRERKVILFNRRAEEIYGYKKEEILGQEVGILVPPQYRKMERAWYDILLKTGSSPVLGRPTELQGLRKDGTEVPLEYSFSMHMGVGEGFSIAVVRDITERKRLEKELIDKEKFSALMEMAGATAHELNQPLTTILGTVEMIMRKSREEEPQYRHLLLISKEVKRLSHMIKKIRKVIRYETKPYLGEVSIIDIDKASKKREIER